MVVDSNSDPLRLTVLGMDDRSLNTFCMFLQGLCQNKGVLVSQQSAEATVVDMDVLNANDLIAREKQEYPHRPIIALSLAAPSEPDIIHVRKPIQAPSIMAAIDQVRKNLANGGADSNPRANSETEGVGHASVVIKREAKSLSEIHSGAHETAMQLDERTYTSFVGAVPDIDASDSQQVKLAHYDTQRYLQAYVQSATKLAVSKNRILRLHCGWKPITIFPHAREVWVDTDDKQLRAFCVVPIRSVSAIDVSGTCKASKIKVTPVNLNEENGAHDPSKFQSMDAFLWKLALWTAHGRIPVGVSLDQPVYLRHWPNLSRFVVIPHSLRIAAMLVDQPRTLLEVADVLQIPQQYVFSFFSAAWALGLTGQAKQQIDTLASSSSAPNPKRGGLLQKIIARLRIK